MKFHPSFAIAAREIGAGAEITWMAYQGSASTWKWQGPSNPSLPVVIILFGFQVQPVLWSPGSAGLSAWNR